MAVSQFSIAHLLVIVTTSVPPDANISSTESIEYWKSVNATVDGMLGGYPQISRIDLQGSANFLAKLRREHPAPSIHGTLRRGVDCGAGIGHITAGFLGGVCDVVDIVEPIEKFAQEAKAVELSSNGTIGSVYVKVLEDWEPEHRYDLMWNQWCLGHLKDDQLVAYLNRCKGAVTIHGWIIIKENMSTDAAGKDIFDTTDSSVTRTHGKFQQPFEKSGLSLVKTEIQRGFPKSLFPVRLYALRHS